MIQNENKSINLIPENIKKKIIDKKQLRVLEIFGAIFGIVLGTLLHFTFEWFGRNIYVGLFSAVNESVWEHTKLFFFPVILFMVVEYYYLRNPKKLLWAKFVESVFGILFLISFYYTYTGVLGFESLFIDIGSFIFAAIIGKYISYKLLIKDKEPLTSPFILAISLIAIIIFFIYATFTPPPVSLFKETETNTYGMYKIP